MRMIFEGKVTVLFKVKVYYIYICCLINWLIIFLEICYEDVVWFGC